VPGSDAWSKWKDIPVPIIIRFRIFNVTNPVAVQNGAKPKLVEAGPYAYEYEKILKKMSYANRKINPKALS